MAEFRAALLAGRGIIEVAGPAARDFLQGLVTTDVESLAEGTARSGALLTPQGKILFEFIIIPAGPDRFLLDCPAATAGDLARRLLFYRLRARVDIAGRADDAVVALWGGDAQPLAAAIRDPRLAELGWRAIVAKAEADALLARFAASSEADYHAHRIRLGVAELGSDYQGGAVFPHEADLDQLGGVAFDKGCFVGQEVVSRMQHRGTARSRFVPVAIEGAAPEAGTTVEADGKAVGTMGSSAGGRGLALLRLDRIGEAMAAGRPIRAGEARLTPERPGWARFDWPGTTS